MRKSPAVWYYFGDWRSDTPLQSCSLAARGLWHEMNCIMHDADPYGHLCVRGHPIAPEVLARMVGEPAESVRRLLDELESAGVFSRAETGVIYSRRMVRDEKARAAWRERQRRHREAQGEAEKEPEPPKRKEAAPLFFAGQHLQITEVQHRTLGSAFPWVDLPQEYRKMDSWLVANGGAKYKYWSRFAHNWCSKIPAPSGGQKVSRERERIQRTLQGLDELDKDKGNENDD